MKNQAKTHTCFKCKTVMPALEALQYKDKHWYCKSCYNDKANWEWFSNQICTIFGLKAPGPRINAERKRLQETYGYTDSTIIEALKYALFEKHLTPIEPSLYLVTTSLIDEMTAKRRSLKLDAEKASYLISDEPSLDNKIIVNYHDADHPIRVKPRVSVSWDDLLGEEEDFE